MCERMSPIGRKPDASEARWMSRLAWVLLCCLLLLAPACKVSAPENVGSSRVHDEKDYSANAEQMRLRMRGLVLPFCGEIVAAADQITASTTDPAIQREALLWKIEAVPAVREALFQPNPKTALLDTWVMTFQMADYFEKGLGARGLGEARGIAVTTSQHLEAEIAKVATSMTFSGDMTRARNFARKWAAEHPMRHSIASRESTLSLATEKDLADVFSTSEAVGSLVVSVDDVNRRLEIYSAQLPEQSRWQAELFAMDLSRQHGLDEVAPLAESAIKSAERAMNALERTLPAVERALAVVEGMPAMITAEREATVKAVTEGLAGISAFVHEERLAILQQVTAERVTTVQEVGQALNKQQELLTRDSERITLAAVDHTFLRAAQLCAALLVAVFLGGLLLLVARRVLAHPRDGGSVRPEGGSTRRRRYWRSFESLVRGGHSDVSHR